MSRDIADGPGTDRRGVGIRGAPHARDEVGDSVPHRRTSLGHDLDTRTRVSELPPLSEPQGRDALFTAACRRFAEIYDLEENLQFTPPGSLAEQTYGLTLAVHMAALSVVDAHAQGHTPPAGSGDLSTYLLARERRYWQRLHDRTATAAARCVFVAALTGPLTHSAGRALLDQIGLPAGHSTTSQELLDAHARCYPPTAPGTVLEPLYPDRLAEAFVALTLTGPHPQGDTWAAATITRSAAHQPGQYRG